MRRILFIFLFTFAYLFSYSQMTHFNSSWTTGSTEQCGRLSSVEIKPDGVVVTIEIKALKALKRLVIFSTYNTYITSGNLKLLQLEGLIVGNEIKSCGYESGWGWTNVAMGAVNSYQLFFKGKLPPGITNISIVDYGDYNGAHGYIFNNCIINNPRSNYLNYQSEYAVKQHIDQNNDGVCGIYETIDDNGAKVACVKHNNEYCLIYLSAPSSYQGRNFGRLEILKPN